MSKEALVAELRAVGASVETATSAAENADWFLSEQALLDAQERSARLLRELALMRADVMGEMAMSAKPPPAPK